MDIKFYKLHKAKNNHLGGFVVQASKHIKILILFVILVTGMIIGNFLLKINDNTYIITKNIFSEYTLSLTERTLLQHFLNQCTINISMLFIYFISGLCAIGFPTPIIFTLLKGISIGALSTFLYSEYTLKGFVYCILILYPIQIVLNLIILKAGKESLTMSKNIFKILTEQKQKSEDNNYFKIYLLHYLVLVSVTILISLICSLLSIYIVPLFKF